MPSTHGLWPELNRQKNSSKAKIDEIFKYTDFDRFRLFALVSGGSECGTMNAAKIAK